MIYDELKNIQQALGFVSESDIPLFTKQYFAHSCAITIDERKKKIIYPAGIQLGDDTTANFSHPENFVVLECVDRLLRKGYRPEDLHLEKKWSLGRTQKGGKADIIIRGSDGRTLLIIECKTWGEEYEKEKRRMQSNGGQLFSYLQQEQSAQYLCLYTSIVENGEVCFENAIIHIEDDAKLLEQADKSSDEIRLYRDARNVEDFHLAWKESYSCYFHPNGIFDEDVQPYQIKLKALTLKDLKEIKQGDSGFIHNQFAEILRHNNISDKENAFNKMISLFLCKVVDENRGDKDELAFQWKEGVDSYEDLQDRLLKLYHEGMEIYLKENIVYYGNDYVETAFKHHKKAVAKDLMNEMLKALKFYTNNEFAFKEVHNKKLFEQNAKVVNEVVQLLQPYRIKYSNKQQFLGNLFELLLNDGLKQSEGQFFTPIPITRLILSSLPIRELIESRMAGGLVNRLPRVVDYACGSGHFLTEAIDEIQASIEALNISDYRDNTGWARDYIFGIEKDYRLARTAKIACFLNGAGDARIIYGDGLEEHDDLGGRENFDILIANPPYSIKDFKQHLRLKRNSFELLPFISDNASEIETLFIERIRQLLRPGGMAGIVLPSSILSNSGIYTRAREIILKHFHLRAVVELGGQTFIATNTNTVILFMQKRTNEDSKHFAYRCDTIFDDGLFDDPEFQDNHLLQDYCRKIGVDYDDYVSLVQKRPTDDLKKGEFLTAYRRWFDGLTEIVKLKENAGFKKKALKVQQDELEFLFLVKTLEREKEKFFHFCLAHGQQVVIVKAGDKEKEKAFLGYEWSKRRGQEGMKFIGTGKLYDEADFGNPARVNSYIRQAFLNLVPPPSRGRLGGGWGSSVSATDQNLPHPHPIPPLEGEGANSVHPDVADYVSYARLIDMMDFSRIEFDKQIGLNFKNTATIESRWPLVRLGEITEIYNGGTPKSDNKAFWDGGINWATLVDTKQKYLYKTARSISSEGLKNSNAQLLPVNAVLFSSRATIGDVSIAKVETTTNQGYKNFVCRKDKLDPEYLYYILKREFKNIEALASGMTYSEISKSQISDYKIHLPPLNIQQKIVEEIEAVEKQALQDAEKIQQYRREISSIIEGFSQEKRISDACTLSAERTDPGNQPDSDFNYIGLEHIESNSGELVEQAVVKGSTLKSTKNCFTPGCLLYGKLRPYLNKVFLADFEGVCSTDILVLLPQNGIILKHVLLNKSFTDKTAELTKGTSLPRIGVKEFQHLTVKWPADKDQTRIVTELDAREKRIRDLKGAIVAAEGKKAEILEGYLR